MKKCKICGEYKNINDFYVNRTTKDGYFTHCKICDKEKRNQYYIEYRKNNVDKKKEYNKKYSINNKEKLKEYRNKNNRTEYFRNYMNYRYKTDIIYKLSKVIRHLVYSSMKRQGYTKNSKTYELLGCTCKEFKEYLESKFETWMTWENYGKYNGELNHGWDIDHIIPFNSAKSEEELIKLNHYSNLQPLCSYTNRHIKDNYSKK